MTTMKNSQLYKKTNQEPFKEVHADKRMPIWTYQRGRLLLKIRVLFKIK